ncbi:MAG: very short patch repair endonuclease [Deltaproteobacteria bacterium]|jgi:DNA mismatch endonuclease (patch repair protein)|nr:very short patch repair endonuclease [Deltaproteobacteria bacterium]
MARSPDLTRKIMRRVKSQNTAPELKLRRALWARGFRYRVNVKDLPGRPDIVFLKAKIAIFCDGDFWHGHNWALRGWPSLAAELRSYTPYWREKIKRNIKRDLAVTLALARQNFLVLRFWTSDIMANVSACVDLIEANYLKSR